MATSKCIAWCVCIPSRRCGCTDLSRPPQITDSPTPSDNNIELQPLISDDSVSENVFARFRSTRLITDNTVLQELLRRFQLDKRSTILHSLHPEHTPHIVITPAPNCTSCEPDGYWENRLSTQWIGWLMVPPRQWDWPTYVPPPYEGQQGGWWYVGGYSAQPPLPPYEQHEVDLVVQDPPAIDAAQFKRMVR